VRLTQNLKDEKARTAGKMTDMDMDDLLRQMEDASEGSSSNSSASSSSNSSASSSNSSTSSEAKARVKAKGSGPVPLSATGQPIWNPSVEIHDEALLHRRAPQPLPSLYIEAERHNAVYALHTGFLRKCKAKGLDIKTPTFERWCFNQRDEACSDPVLPSGKCHLDEGLKQVSNDKLLSP
jgi:hypothetical protein